eukprot:Awhi_evm1s7931
MMLEKQALIRPFGSTGRLVAVTINCVAFLIVLVTCVIVLGSVDTHEYMVGDSENVLKQHVCQADGENCKTIYEEHHAIVSFIYPFTLVFVVTTWWFTISLKRSLNNINKFGTEDSLNLNSLYAQNRNYERREPDTTTAAIKSVQ